MEIIHGKNIQKNFLKEVSTTISLLGLKPTIAILSTGEDPIQKQYLNQLKRISNQVGIQIKHYHFIYISQEKMLSLIDTLNNDKEITGILVSYPLIENLNESVIRNQIKPSKDIEGLNDQNRLKNRDHLSSFIPCTALGIILLFNSYNINIENQNIVIINRSIRIGLPLLDYFLNRQATVTICHSHTKNITSHLKDADIVITGVGKPAMINSQQLKKDSILVDAGMSYVGNRIVGDAIVEESSPIKYYIPPNGGVGPMTIAAFAQNVLTSCYLNQEDKFFESTES